MKKYIYFLFALLIAFTSCKSEGKELRKALREGNKEYESERYVDAEVEYRRAQDEDMRSSDAAYNLGNSLFRQNKKEEAQKQYKFVEDNEADKEKKAMAWHNSGNICMANKDYKGAVDAYRHSMRNNPDDDETRYNLALAQWLLKKEEEQQQNQDQNQEQQDQEQEQEQQNQDQKDQEQDQNQDQQQNQDQKDQEDEQKEEQQQQNSSQMSQEQAEQILEALMQEERNTQEKVQMQEQQNVRQQVIDKNW